MTVLRSNSAGRTAEPLLPASVTIALKKRCWQLTGMALIGAAVIMGAAVLSYAPGDPSFNSATDNAPINLAGHWGAVFSDLVLQIVGYAALIVPLAFTVWSAMILSHGTLARPGGRFGWLTMAVILSAVGFAGFATPNGWPLVAGLGGVAGALAYNELVMWAGRLGIRPAPDVVLWTTLTLAMAATIISLGMGPRDWVNAARGAWQGLKRGYALSLSVFGAARDLGERAHDFRDRLKEFAPLKPINGVPAAYQDPNDDDDDDEEEVHKGGVLDAAFGGTGKRETVVDPRPKRAKPGRKAEARRQQTLPLGTGEDFTPPPLELLDLAQSTREETRESREALQQNARYLSTVLEEYGIKGEIVKVRPGPVVTLYELEPAPGTKTSRVIGLADDIARSMSAVSVRVATVPGRNVIGIEMPNAHREMVHLRELLASSDFEKTKAELPLALGKDIGGAPVTVDLVRMPHLLIAGTTGSGKSVAMNTMILSLLYNLSPEQCKFIMIDPKMLELSVYQEIPHLLTPVVTDPTKAVVALKWVVREMEDRYRNMSQMGVRNIGGYNARLAEAKKKNENLTRTVQTGFDDDGKPIYEEQPLPMDPLPFIVVVVDEMADLMMVAGKDVEAAIQRLAQMARAAGIHLMMATQRPSVDVITGTIKANFPSRISFQVTSKIDSRTILGEQGAEQLLGQGDMLYMAGGGRISRVHGPFVSDEEVERVVSHLKSQAAPDYIEAITEDTGEPVFGETDAGSADYDEHYDQAVALVAREGKASTSFIQRHFQIGYNRAARIVETMEREGVVSQANRVGRREVLIGDHSS
jgi:DNA segregation ATPase FtsK/SpoIIIE, S-DNA-T family